MHFAYSDGEKGAAVPQKVERVVQKIGGSIPSFSSPHVDVCLGKILNPKLFPMVAPKMHECVSEWVNVTCSVKSTLSD